MNHDNDDDARIGLSDEFLRRTRDPVLLALAARIFRQARARADVAAAKGRK